MLYSSAFKCRCLNIPGCGIELFKEKLKLNHTPVGDIEYSFGIVRNPLDRIADIYCKFDSDFKEKYSFFNWINNGNIKKLIKPQTQYLHSNFDIGKFEFMHGNVDDFWFNICCEINLTYRPFEESINWTERNYYNVHYDQEHANIVADIFKDDMETFNYTTEDI